MSAFVDALRAADKAATGAPWVTNSREVKSREFRIAECDFVATQYRGASLVEAQENARITVLLRNAAPEIAALVEAVDEASAVACQVGMVRYVEIDADEWARVRAALSRLEKTVKP